MAYRRGGIPPPGQYQNSQAPPPVRIPQGADMSPSMDQSNYLRRYPSFDNGDDTSYRENANGAGQERGYGARPYRASSNAGVQHNELFMGTTNPTGQAPAYASVTSLGGYLHQDPPVATSTMQPSYNPQHY
ncbi:MAG: hypothetical protein Q9210_005846, partial [Variospora velana]